MTNLRSLLVEALRWIDEHWPEQPNEDTTSLRERIDAALIADEPRSCPVCNDPDASECRCHPDEQWKASEPREERLLNLLREVDAAVTSWEGHGELKRRIRGELNRDGDRG